MKTKQNKNSASVVIWEVKIKTQEKMPLHLCQNGWGPKDREQQEMLVRMWQRGTLDGDVNEYNHYREQ